mmetsp:Transcript_71860/g.116536  ORF Transcript_71860/g.116536 Transcript_71860/m.116536 type:complete len:293 (-) Transcript_71860:669-1547(-)
MDLTSSSLAFSSLPAAPAGFFPLAVANNFWAAAEISGESFMPPAKQRANTTRNRRPSTTSASLILPSLVTPPNSAVPLLASSSTVATASFMADINSSAAVAQPAAPAFQAESAWSVMTKALSVRGTSLLNAEDTASADARPSILSPPTLAAATILSAALKVASAASPAPKAQFPPVETCASSEVLLMDTSLAIACANLARVVGLRAGCILLAKVLEPSIERSQIVTTWMKFACKKCTNERVMLSTTLSTAPHQPKSVIMYAGPTWSTMVWNSGPPLHQPPGSRWMPTARAWP